jgi:hypothetical protein
VSEFRDNEERLEDELTKANDEIKRLRDAHQKIIDLEGHAYQIIQNFYDAKDISKKALEVNGEV